MTTRLPQTLRDPEPGDPTMGGAGADRFYATRLRQLAHLELDEPEARKLWHDVGLHRQRLREQLGRDVGQRVALLDYLVNVRRQVQDPQIIERADLQAIEHQAIVDPLTGLYNRRYFDTALAREAQRCRRYGLSSSLVLVDLDHFKDVNDRFGHEVGDAVLRRIAAVLAHHVRAPDVACRCGGDEFALLLPDTPLHEAVIVAERVRQSILASFRQEPVNGHTLALTASAGVAAMTDEAGSVERLFGWADRAMYATKRRGGDGVSEGAR